MRLRPLPGLATSCSGIVLGTGGFGTAVPREQAFAMLDAFAAAGGTLLDTAHIYAAWLPGGGGLSERCLGAWLAARGMSGRMQVGTKGGHPHLASMQVSRLRPADIASDLGESLERLAQPRVALYWLHRDDEAIPVDEILDALQPHLRAGTISAIGASNWSWRRLQTAQACAAARGWTGFAASQICWSLADFAPGHRFGGGMIGMDAETLAFHAASGLAQIPYSAQANGFFAKPLALTRERLKQYAHPANEARWHAAQRLAATHGVSANAIALAWLLQHPQGGFGIIGPKDLGQLEDSLSAADLVLSAAEWAELTARG